ncbi:hypothetical protein CTZ28_36575 [Streptomyces shenzhenensis]|uniref:Uncharacterized protein n=1 Tax=Streptomyces shenzhenensis TaxID=943815 RepID=A0A3M0HUH9_9ACTN|nr:hypothetical protein CTZ28_36575 [Streptomyces shenzhenensis]
MVQRKQLADLRIWQPWGPCRDCWPGNGPDLDSEFVVAAGDLSAHADAGHLASAAGSASARCRSGAAVGGEQQPFLLGGLFVAVQGLVRGCGAGIRSGSGRTRRWRPRRRRERRPRPVW